MSNKKRGLGRGLSALLENAETDVTSRLDATANTSVVGSVSMLSVNSIEANPFQPRTTFEKEALEELVASIKEHGIIQPVTVRKLGNDRFQLISGERRFRSSQILGLTEVPAYVRVANDQAMLEMALVENIQRQELDPIEVAISYKRLIDECSLTHEDLSQKISKSRSAITNYLRLLQLPAKIQEALRERKLTMGHARALLSVKSVAEQLELFEQIINDKLSVRDVEASTKSKKEPKEKKELSYLQYNAKSDMAKFFDSKVDIKTGPKGKGKIVIPFESDEKFQQIIDLLNL